MSAPQPARSAVLTHHWLVRRRGGEKVLEALAALVGPANVYTLVHDANGYPSPFQKVHTSWLQRLPGAKSRYSNYLPLMPAAARSIRLPQVDLVVCSDAALAKAMTPHPSSRVICYCHSPMRYAWEAHIAAEYGATLFPPLRPLWPALCSYLRRVDRRAAQRVDQFIANSTAVAERIRRCYGRESVVVHPPVELPETPATTRREDYFLCVGYHVAYKRLALAVAACVRMKARLVVIGDGPEVVRQRAAGPPGVEFLGFQSDEVIRRHYRTARALLFPGEEDFGIVPVEAIAHGCPVIAFGRGGARETVEENVSGAFFNEPGADALIEAMQRCQRSSYDPGAMLKSARRFSAETFHSKMAAILAD